MVQHLASVQKTPFVHLSNWPYWSNPTEHTLVRPLAQMAHQHL